VQQISTSLTDRKDVTPDTWKGLAVTAFCAEPSRGIKRLEAMDDFTQN